MKTQVLIIGGGATGTGLARDLALRGVECILVEKKDINAGASGGNHGLLHSGARYIESDPTAACECREEGDILKRLASHCIDNTGGLFVAVEGDDENFIADFPLLCTECNIPAHVVDPIEARELEPALSEKIIAAYAVPDAAIDPFKLSLDNLSQARQLGTALLCHTRVVAFTIRKLKIQSVHLENTRTGEKFIIEADMVVNAAGAWADRVAALAGTNFPILYSKGSLLVTQSRLATRVINRLRKATDADIVVPGGGVSILGTTSVRVETPDVIYPEIGEIDFIIDEGSVMLPVLETTRYIRAYCGVRPLISTEGDGDDRRVSRGFALMDHSEKGVDNFITITGGKLTTYRLMAEKAADKVCDRLGINRPCTTHIEPLPATLDAKWTEPSLAPNLWVRKNNPDDLLLCECEMVPQSAVDEIITSIRKQIGPPSLQEIGLRSRVGKGPCQGTFCSQRVAAYLYNGGHLENDQGLDNLCAFLSERWRGQRPLQWNMPLIQSELLEALHCGLCGLELTRAAGREKADNANPA